ncbi:cilia- and flagella-associated protein 57 [Ceratina calcarata]|uniref:Cilia- and flagella-associated protein 57 n=1 Tax=Ceratina calcarata TaxID=156304 RepID=A0AAJ7N8K3_9HYME|nr:cilia- and flagella-associated protein 57 [Ceratina calcarata]XP_017883098.1 cilia- and flagella-associated protein 57 [Ceratina calcarata]XP_017883099.1 cilia- and flagella-associated protein 57 [Ceratina calcarata]
MIPTLQTRVFYGLKTDINSNAHYISDVEILYPVGNVIAVHNIPQFRQRLIRLPEKQQINIIQVSHSKKYVATCEVGEKPTISIYDLQTLKKKKVLGIPYDAPGVTKFTCIGFTFDNKYIAAVTGEPDQTMLFYNWEKGKVESSLKVGTPQNPMAIVELIACNPSDIGVIALGGPCTFKFLTLSDTIWRPYGFSKADNILSCSMAWLNSDRLLVGTKDGRILYLENGDLKNIYKMTDTLHMNLKIREEYVIQASSSLTAVDSKQDIPQENYVRCLIAFQRGFAYAFGPRTIVVFEKEGLHKYVKRNIYVIPTQVSKQDNEKLYIVNSIQINLSYDRLLITTGWPQLFYAKLWGPDLNVDPEPQSLQIMGQALHFGPISGLSMCAWKSIFMTFGDLDHSVRLWDFESETMILHKQYAEDICGIALHPTGLFCLIGFSDKLRFMSILIDDLLPMEEFSIRCCKTMEFSYGGHMFAAVNGNIVQIYSTIGFTSCFILKGHTNRVKALLWSQTDTKLLTMGAEGAVYQWDINTGKRTSEIIIKGIVLLDIALSIDEQTSYCIADDSAIHEIKENSVRQHNVPDVNMYCMVLGKDDQSLFLVCPGGIILSVKTPVQEPVQYSTFHMHSVDITKIALSYNEQYLISTAVDGGLCIWKVNYPEGKGKIGKELKYTNEVLISKGDLVEKINTIIGLNVRMRELETEHAYKMRQIEVVHNDNVRDIHQGYLEAIKELREKISRQQEDHKNELNAINVEIVKMKEQHEDTMKQVEANYDAKLIMEYDRYLALENSMNAMRQDYEKRLEQLESHGIQELEKATNKYEALLHEKKLQLEESQDEMTQQVRVHEQMMTEVEDDADKEILELRTNYEAQLCEEKELNIRLKGEAGMMRNRYLASLKDVEELKRQVERVQSEYSYFQKTIQELEKDKEDLKKEIDERDVTIHDRERQIYELKRTNQELEKFKFVLNYKITELKNQIEPRDQEIKELKEKIRDMETELVNLHKTTVSLELQLYELREKLGAARRELQYEVHRNKRCQQLMKKIRVDLLDASGLVQEPSALKTAIMKLYHKYSSSDEFLRTRKADLDAQCEFIKQRDHLERTIASLRKQVFQDKETGGKDIDKTVEENIMLITELNALREELKEARRHIQHMDGLLGFTKKEVKPSEARKKLEQACYGHEQLRDEYRSQMQECQNIIIALKDDMYKLISKIPCEEPETKITF